MDSVYVVAVSGCEAFRLKIAGVETPFRGNLLETLLEALRVKNPSMVPEACFSAVWPMDITLLRPAEMKELCSIVKPNPSITIPAVESIGGLVSDTEDLLATIRVSRQLTSFTPLAQCLIRIARSICQLNEHVKEYGGSYLWRKEEDVCSFDDDVIDVHLSSLLHQSLQNTSCVLLHSFPRELETLLFEIPSFFAFTDRVAYLLAIFGIFQLETPSLSIPSTLSTLCEIDGSPAGLLPSLNPS